MSARENKGQFKYPCIKSRKTIFLDVDLNVYSISFVVSVMKFRETDLEVHSGNKFREMQNTITTMMEIEEPLKSKHGGENDT